MTICGHRWAQKIFILRQLLAGSGGGSTSKILIGAALVSFAVLTAGAGAGFLSLGAGLTAGTFTLGAAGLNSDRKYWYGNDSWWCG